MEISLEAEQICYLQLLLLLLVMILFHLLGCVCYFCRVRWEKILRGLRGGRKIHNRGFIPAGLDGKEYCQD